MTRAIDTSFASWRSRGSIWWPRRPVRKRWALNAGDHFNQHYPAIFLNRVRAEQMFDNLQTTDWQMKADEVEKAVDVQLIFK